MVKFKKSKNRVANNGDAVTGWAQSTDARVQPAFEAVKKWIVIFGVMSVVVLATVAAVAIAHGSVSTFMWVRASILPVIAPVFYRRAISASQGARKDYERLRTVTAVLPIAIIAIDMIPGVCPVWYASMQAASMAPLIAIAVIARRRTVGARFRRPPEAR
jgi:hypothetical protein